MIDMTVVHIRHHTPPLHTIALYHPHDDDTYHHHHQPATITTTIAFTETLLPRPAAVTMQ
jgi:hypothetical protein